jgi:hypothetical protein
MTGMTPQIGSLTVYHVGAITSCATVVAPTAGTLGDVA